MRDHCKGSGSAKRVGCSEFSSDAIAAAIVASKLALSKKRSGAVSGS
jgi:hypothetical protein